MIDLTKIDKPFGLLDAETQDALSEHFERGGAVQRFDGYGWKPMPSDAPWNGARTFRAKPKTSDMEAIAEELAKALEPFAPNDAFGVDAWDTDDYFPQVTFGHLRSARAALAAYRAASDPQSMHEAARHIAATNPQAMASIAAYVAELEAERDALTDALDEFRDQILAVFDDAFASGRKAGMEEAAIACDEIDNSCGMEAGLAAHCAKYIRALAREGD